MRRRARTSAAWRWLLASTAAGALGCTFQSDTVDLSALRKVDEDTCRPHTVLPTVQMPMPGNGVSNPQCALDESGTVTLELSLPRCEMNNSWWAGCEFAANQDFDPFDRQWGAKGVIAAELCVENLLPSGVNVWYGVGQLRKSLPLVARNYGLTGTACTTVYLGPGDACWGIGSCDTPCRPEGTGSDDACVHFDKTPLTLMNEWCASEGAMSTAPTRIKLRSLTYYPEACGCQEDRDCTAPKICRRDGWPINASCAAGDGRCTGICSK